MLEKVTLTRISSTDKKADGTELTGKWGKFYRIGIQTEEYGESWINGFSNKPVDWQVGDVLEVVITKEDYKGTEQLKFKLPNKESDIENRLKKLEDSVFGQVVDVPTEKKEKDTQTEDDDSF